MPTSIQLQLLSKTPFGNIEGKQFCVWGDQLSWDTTGVPPELSGKVGMVLPAHLDTKDPALYPDVPEIQDTHIRKQAGTDRQYIYKDAPQAGDADVEFFFLAPCAEDSFVPVLLATSQLEAGPWKSLAFKVDATSEAGLVHTMRGPAVVVPGPTTPQPVTAGNLGGAGRRIAKCTYVPLTFDRPVPADG